MQRKLVKNLLLVLTLVVLSLAVGMTASAEDTYIDGYYTYQVENGEVTIVDVDTSISGDVIIPETLGGYPVTSIGDRAFEYCGNIENVIIPEGVTFISGWAFDYCWSLISATIPDSVTHLYDGTFNACVSIEKLYIGKNLEFWDTEVFYNQVPNFTDVIVDEENPYFLSENGVLYNKDKTELIHYPQGKLDDTFIIPNTVKKIRDYAVYQTVYLEKVIIPDSVEEIGCGAFCYSYSLQEFHVGKNVKNIDHGAFHIGLLIGTSKEYPKLYIESPDAVFEDFAFGISETIITCDEDIFRAYVEGTKELSGIERAIALNEDIENITEIYWEERPYGIIYAHDESCSAVEYAKSMGVEYELVHFYEDEWTYDYDNMIRTRKCIHCDVTETEALEPTTPDEPTVPDEPITPDEPVTPDEPQEETKDDLFKNIFDLIMMLFELIVSMFKK